MLGRQLVAAIVGGLIVFFWGFLSWAVLMDTWHGSVMHPLPAETATHLKDTAKLKSGVYLFPLREGYPTRESTDAEKADHEKRHKDGPLGMLYFKAEGAAMMEPMVLVKGLGICAAAGFLAAIIAGYMAQAGAGFVGRFIAVLLLPLFAVVARDFLQWNFFSHPDDYTVNMAADVLIGWVPAGLVIAAIVKPDAPTPRPAPARA